MIWFTADTHFFHKGVIDYCSRPWNTVEEMNEGLIQNWNKWVKPKERIYVLGDFAFCGKEKMKSILFRLNGQKILVKGNHDQSARKMIEAGFHDVWENELITLPNGEKVTLSHFPIFPNENKGDQRYLHKRISSEVVPIIWHLHGHVHTEYRIDRDDMQINVGVDVNNWQPVGHEEIQTIIKDCDLHEDYQYLASRK